MIGIGTIGRAAESGGGSTTYQNGQYIAFVIGASSAYTLYYSDDFGATFKTRTTPLPTARTYSVYINYLGEIMLVYVTSLYYAASFTSDWVLIENKHIAGRCEVSWDFNTIIYSNVTNNYSLSYYLSTNKGISFTLKTVTGSSYSNSLIDFVMSGDGSKVMALHSYYGIYIVFDSITGAYITNSKSKSNYLFRSSDYYGNYFTGSLTVSPQTSCIKHLTTSTPFNLNSSDGYLTEYSNNGWCCTYNQSNSTIYFYNSPSFSPYYKSVKTPNTLNFRFIASSVRQVYVSGDYVYFCCAPSGATYLNIYKLDSIVGHSYELINQFNFGSNYELASQAVSRVPLTLL